MCPSEDYRIFLIHPPLDRGLSATRIGNFVGQQSATFTITFRLSSQSINGRNFQLIRHNDDLAGRYPTLI